MFTPKLPTAVLKKHVFCFCSKIAMVEQSCPKTATALSWTQSCLKDTSMRRCSEKIQIVDNTKTSTLKKIKEEEAGSSMSIRLTNGTRNITILCVGNPDIPTQTETVMGVSCEMYMYIMYDFNVLHTRH